MSDSQADQDVQKKGGFFSRLRKKINRGESWLTADLGELFSGDEISDDLVEELETRLLMADVGVEATQKIMGDVEKKIARKELRNVKELYAALRTSMLEILEPCNQPLRLRGAEGPFVILMVGVNGAGKTTTIGKLAKRFRDNGVSVMLAAGDTFRAAAVEQLQTWGERNNVPVVAQATGADPAAVVFDAFQAAKSREVDVLIADTAGRLHTQDGLMDELKKIRRVLGRIDEDAPHEVMLVIDASNGQNALAQASQFHDSVGITGITMTKLDGTAKGGILLAVAAKVGVPIRYVGVGESAEDLGTFEAEQYVDAVLKGAEAN